MHTCDYEEMDLATIMNLLSFNKDSGSRFGANFISVYNKQKDCYEYFVQQLIGIEIENDKKPSEGSMWIPYINGKKSDWQEISEKEIKVKSSDEIIWRFHKLGEDLSSNRVTQQ